MNIHRILQYYYEHPEKFKIYHNNEDQITHGLFKSKIFNSVSMPVFESWVGGDIGYERITFMRNGIIRETRLLCGTLIFEYNEIIRDWLRTNIIDIKRYFDFGQCHMMTFIDPLTNEKSLIVSLPVYAYPVTRFLFIQDIIQRIQALPVEKLDVKFVRPKYVLSNRYQHILEMVHRFMDVVESRYKETFVSLVIPDKEIFKPKSPQPTPTPQPFTDDARCVRSVKYLMLMGSPEYHYEEMLKQYPEKPFRVPKNEIWTLVHYPNGIIINSIYDISHWLRHPLLKEISINYTDKTILITRDVFGFMCERFTKHSITGPTPISKIKVKQLLGLRNIRYIHVTLNENKYVMNT